MPFPAKLAAPATAKTRHLVNAALLEQVKPGVHLVNIARGSLVDQDALRVALDLLWVKFAMRFLQRPLHAFGAGGLALMVPGLAILAYLTFDKLALGNPIGGRPLLLLGVLLAVMGLQLLGIGVIGELITRVYHEPQGRRQYVLRSSSPAPTERVR